MKRTIFEPEHEQFRDTVRRFFQNEIGPNAERWREQGHVDREAYVKAGELGLLLTWADEKYGGAGISDLRYEQIVSEENMRHGDPGFYIHLHSNLVAPYLGHLGNDEQKARWLPDCISGNKILAIALTEPHAGSDLAAMRTTAVEEDDCWVLNGSKTYISNGQLADLVIVAARTSKTEKHRVGLFVVEAGQAGFARGQRLKKMGLESQDTSELFFEDVRVPKENVLGDPERGFHYLTEFLAGERIVVAIAALAAAQTAFDLTLDYVKERGAFGRPIGMFQNSRFELARMRAEIDTVQTFVDQCVMLQNDRALDGDTAAAAKLMATELEGTVMDRCVQLHGGAGYMKEYRICRMYTDARVSRIFAGTSEIMLEIIGRGLGLDERKLN
ncbi:MAG: acyl-CoA dehydrogenase [Confluentimicrobium sp.]|jgi:acyl-CoA dehydrogenase|uniref:acyl-CoA dehydrogenase family protein n=1 Tax=Actibacterium sp. TaxID=1872125 RepID=UPI000C5B9386|nr:acyl-CoA dehydrogenase family protein [Actibacterium sp.]MBC57131.1 acyl-CoA dehydrogenase [Actibacterium sp.]|tara:strand:+ start:11280 stop:12437 length:1158 start_codon:yes stop_codon:yes gene_type:complete